MRAHRGYYYFLVFSAVGAIFSIFCIYRSNLFDVLDRRMVLVGIQNDLVTVEAHVTHRTSDQDFSELSGRRLAHCNRYRWYRLQSRCAETHVVRC